MTSKDKYMAKWGIILFLVWIGLLAFAAYFEAKANSKKWSMPADWKIGVPPQVPFDPTVSDPIITI